MLWTAEARTDLLPGDGQCLTVLGTCTCARQSRKPNARNTGQDGIVISPIISLTGVPDLTSPIEITGLGPTNDY